MTRILTIFDRAENVHLTKDVGQIPYFLGKMLGKKAALLSSSGSVDWPSLRGLEEHLELILVKRVSLFGVNLSTILFLLKNSKKVDFLHLFHLRLPTLIYILIYRLINRRGYIYVKLDVSESNVYEGGFLYKRRRAVFLYWLEVVMFRCLSGGIDSISVETRAGFDHLRCLYPNNSFELFYIPNGLDEESYRAALSAAGRKGKNILHVARIGERQKNSEFLLSVLERADLRDWMVDIIGPVSESFDSQVVDFFLRNPSLKEVVKFHGELADRALVRGFFERAKVFLLTSLWEGYPLVLVEAACYGCHIISTDVSGARDVLADSVNGKIVDQQDIVGFISALNDAISVEENNYNFPEFEVKYSLHRFSWEVNLQQLVNDFTCRGSSLR